jgi:hypothetical protein
MGHIPHSILTPLQHCKGDGVGARAKGLGRGRSEVKTEARMVEYGQLARRTHIWTQPWDGRRWEHGETMHEHEHEASR